MNRRWDVVANSTLDVVYDTVGQGDTGARAVSKLRDGGFYVTITGALAPSTPPGVGQAMFINSDTNLGSADMLDAIGRMVDDGKVHAPHIDGTYPLARVADAFARSRAGHVVGKLSVAVRTDEARPRAREA